MLSMTERLELAKQLRKLRTSLTSRPETYIRDLPQELQSSMRRYAILGPITSSGLEKTRSIIDRINWSIHYLNDPTFPQSYYAEQAKTEERGKKQDDAEASPTDTAPTPKPVNANIQEGNELDFGPFDPRKRE